MRRAEEFVIDTLLFIIALAAAGFGIAWYVLNESSGAAGERGLLSLRTAKDKAAPQGPAWRSKNRSAPSRITGEKNALEGVKEAASGKGPAFRPVKENAARHSNNESAYKASGPPPRFGERVLKDPKE